MREIKFRAWDKELGMSMPFTLRWLAETYSDVHEYTTYMQYTGLKDKNGVEIYEGDLLSFGPESHAYQVTWNDEKALFEFGGRLLHESTYALSVIGNIYSNPELLEQAA